MWRRCRGQEGKRQSERRRRTSPRRAGKTRRFLLLPSLLALSFFASRPLVAGCLIVCLAAGTAYSHSSSERTLRIKQDEARQGRSFKPLFHQLLGILPPCSGNYFTNPAHACSLVSTVLASRTHRYNSFRSKRTRSIQVSLNLPPPMSALLLVSFYFVCSFSACVRLLLLVQRFAYPSPRIPAIALSCVATGWGGRKF